MRPHPAPSAARRASSCCRTSALTSSRFATLAQAISITMADGSHHHPQDVADVAGHILLERRE